MSYLSVSIAAFSLVGSSSISWVVFIIGTGLNNEYFSFFFGFYQEVFFFLVILLGLSFDAGGHSATIVVVFCCRVNAELR